MNQTEIKTERRRCGGTIALVLLALFAMLLCGCTEATGPTPGEDNTYPVYCYALNSDATDIFRIEYKFQSLTTDARIAELLHTFHEQFLLRRSHGYKHDVRLL